MSTHTRPGTYTPQHARARTHTHTHTHTKYAILIACPRKQWLRDRVSLLRYAYVAYLVSCNGDGLFSVRYELIAAHDLNKYVQMMSSLTKFLIK